MSGSDKNSGRVSGKRKDPLPTEPSSFKRPNSEPMSPPVVSSASSSSSSRQPPVLSPLVEHQSRRPSTPALATMSAPPQARGRETTFLTKEDDRAPSAYHIDEHGGTQRIRQQHRDGPTVTPRKQRVQAFTDTKKQANALVRFVDARPDPTDHALRLEIMDGMASPRVAAGRHHVEATVSDKRRGNVHISGGVVRFAEPLSQLADFDSIKDRNEAGELVHDTLVNRRNSAAEAFNAMAIEQQRAFAARILGSPLPPESDGPDDKLRGRGGPDGKDKGRV
ncbi:hypothetical protein ACFJGW_06140 [Burkholderiaceae bacterium UC74_6]